MGDEVMGEQADEAGPTHKDAGFWRRLAAFAVDMMLLALAGWLISLVGRDFWLRGTWHGPALGMVIALAYLGWFGSGHGLGATPGKRLLDLRVVGPGGLPLTLPKALVRAAVIYAPLGLHVVWSALGGRDAAFGPTVWSFPWSFVLVVAALPVVQAYLLVFNRRHRRLLHDFLTGSRVVRWTDTRTQAPPGLWAGHVVICALIVPLLGVGLDAVQRSVTANLAVLDADAQTLITQAMQEPNVVSAEVVVSRQWAGPVAAGPRAGDTSVYVVLRLDHQPQNPEMSARDWAAWFRARSGAAATKLPLNVTLAWGFDLGIFRGRSAYTIRFVPEGQEPAPRAESL